jgi:hypothetical protein
MALAGRLGVPFCWIIGRGYNLILTMRDAKGMVKNPAGTESRCFGWPWLAGIASGSVGYLIITTLALPAKDFRA